jgi:hypothetical protein
MDKTKFVRLDSGTIIKTDCIKCVIVEKYVLTESFLLVAYPAVMYIRYNNSEDGNNNNKLFITDNDYKRLHKILVKDLEYENEIKQLQDEIKKLQDEIYYKPGGDGMKMAQEDFNMLKENKN